VAKKWLDYVEPGDELDSAAALRRTSRNMDDEGEGLLLGEGVLTRNLGLDVVVVVTKVQIYNYYFFFFFLSIDASFF